MTKHLSTLMAATAMLTLSAHAQGLQPTRVTEAIPDQSIPAATMTQDVTGQITTVTEVVQSAPATTVTVSTANDAPASAVAVHTLDPVMVRRQLSVTPQTVVITPEQRSALDRTVIIESEAEPVRRYYNVERNVVIVEERGASRELPYVTVPVLFVVNTAQLLDAESRVALEQTAAVINEIAQTEPGALFDVEGHTSEEGTAEHNMRLSAERSKRIYEELTQRYGVPASSLTAHGYGQNFAMFPEGTEGERQQDRRVLVVRTR